MNRLGAMLLSLGIIVALAVGSVTGGTLVGLPVITGCLAVATTLTIGGLPHDWRSKANVAVAWRLVIINLVSGSAVMVIVALIVGVDTPAGMGFLALAVVPVAAGIPAYASAVAVPPERLSLFALISYLGALVITPPALSLILGADSPWVPVLITVLVGLVIPGILGVTLSATIRRIPTSVRRGFSIGALLVAMVGLGGTLNVSEITSEALGAPALAVVLLALLRAPVGGLIGMTLFRRTAFRPAFAEAAMAGGYKNCALAGAAAIAAGIPAAAVPGALGLVSEAVLLGGVAAFSRCPRDESASDAPGDAGADADTRDRAG